MSILSFIIKKTPIKYDLYSSGKNVGYSMLRSDVVLEAIDSNFEYADLNNIIEIKQIEGISNQLTILDVNNNLYAIGLVESGAADNFTELTFIMGDVKQFSSQGNTHMIILKNDGTLWVHGDNQYGQLGLGDNIARSSFTQVINDLPSNINYVSAGYYSSFVATDNGIFSTGKGGWSSGRNDYSHADVDIFTLCDDTDHIAWGKISSEVKAGTHTLALTSTGDIWACGTGSQGALLDDYANGNHFEFLLSRSGGNYVDIGAFYSTSICFDGTYVYGAGTNSFGELGLGNRTVQVATIRLASSIGNIKAIAYGYNFTFLLTTTGELYTSGADTFGNQGRGTTSSYRETFEQEVQGHYVDRIFTMGIHSGFFLKIQGI